MEYTNDQKKVLDLYSDFMSSNDKNMLVIDGYAGTGKSTILSHIYRDLKSKFRSPVVLSYTGKSTIVLRNKGIEDAFTIHSTIYGYMYDGNKLVSFLKSNLEPYDIILIDEYSMISKKLFDDIRSFGMKTIVFGDSFQLSSPDKDGSVDLTPDYKMTEIQRTSGILTKLANQVRLGDVYDSIYNGMSVAENGESIYVTTKDRDPNLFGYMLRADQILCNTNATRIGLNRFIRSHYEFPDDKPVIGDKLISLKNLWNLGVVNGHGYRLVDYDIEFGTIGMIYKARLIDDTGEEKILKIYPGELLNPGGGIPENLPGDVSIMNFSYCITTHKAQGSEWNNVVVMNDYNSKYKGQEQFIRWYYTSITRAKSNLIIAL